MSTTLMIALFTTHLVSSEANDGGFEKNQLLALEHNNVLVGTMINSYESRSFLAAYNFSLQTQWDIEVGAYVGLVNGYEANEYSYKGALPIASPYIRAGNFQVSLFGEALAFSINIPIR